jgi:hypothetical protein
VIVAARGSLRRDTEPGVSIASREGCEGVRPWQRERMQE